MLFFSSTLSLLLMHYQLFYATHQSTRIMKNLLILLFLSLSFVSCKQEEIKEVEIIKTIDADAEPGLVHTVYFWLNDDVDEASAKSFEDGVWSLEEVPTVKRMFFGPAASTPTRGVTDNSFDYALVMWFDDVAGHDVYQTHPIHLKLVEEQEAKFKRVQVYDNVLDER